MAKDFPSRKPSKPTLCYPQLRTGLTLDEGDLLPDLSASTLAGSPFTSPVPSYEQVAETIPEASEEKETPLIPVARLSTLNPVESTAQEPVK